MPSLMTLRIKRIGTLKKLSDIGKFIVLCCSHIESCRSATYQLTPQSPELVRTFTNFHQTTHM